MLLVTKHLERGPVIGVGRRWILTQCLRGLTQGQRGKCTRENRLVKPPHQARCRGGIHIPPARNYAASPGVQECPDQALRVDESIAFSGTGRAGGENHERTMTPILAEEP